MTKARDLANLLSTSNGKIAGSNLDVSFENISDSGTTGTKVASGTTAQRGSTTGQIRFNTTTGLAEYYDGTQFKSIDSPPVVSSINPTSLGQSVLGSSQSIVITGSNFSTTITVKIIGNDGTEYTPASTTRNSATQITITTPTNLTNTNEPYDIKVINASSLNGTLANGLAINDKPVFSTASGSLGTLQHANRAGSSLTAISFSDEESTPTVSVTSGSIPTGLTLNSNGTFSGTANAVGSNTTSNFTVTATDGAETATRAYSIAVNSPVIITMDYLIVAGGGSGGGSHRGGGGGAGGYRNSFNSETSGRNASSETNVSIAQGTVLTITVGAGGAMPNGGIHGVKGVDSSIAGSGITTITSNGGGGGARYDRDAVAGTYGSGAGAGHGGGAHTATSGTSGQGFDGGDTTGNNNQQGGGGGGASAGGNTGGQTGSRYGGDGLSSSITGSAVTRAGGGGGGAYGNGGKGFGGAGGGANGGWTDTSHGAGVMQTGSSSYSFPASGTANTGGGGGGMSGDTSAGTSYGSGGSGVIILSVPSADYSGTTTGSPTVAVVGSRRVLTFNGTGSYTV